MSVASTKIKCFDDLLNFTKNVQKYQVPEKLFYSNPDKIEWIVSETLFYRRPNRVISAQLNAILKFNGIQVRRESREIDFFFCTFLCLDGKEFNM